MIILDTLALILLPLVASVTDAVPCPTASDPGAVCVCDARDGGTWSP